MWEAADQAGPKPEVDEEVEDKAWAKDEAEAAVALNAKETKTDYKNRGYRRDPREESVVLEIPGDDGRVETKVPNSREIKLVAAWKALHGLEANGIPEGTRTVSVFVVNDRQYKGNGVTFKDIIYQAELELQLEAGFFGRPDLWGAVFTVETDAADRIADLHYREELEYAVGHGVSICSSNDADGVCRSVRTTFLPTLLEPLVRTYRDWIEAERLKTDSLPLVKVQKETAEELLALATVAANRIEAGIAELENEHCLEAFRVANRAMARAARQRFGVQQSRSPDEVKAPEWRAFQLAFLLMNLRGMVEPGHYDRKVVDLLFFPAGGGKTEAYLGLAAFTLVLRGLANPGISSAGVSIIMRYTLRLLTLDQLGRAAALMCALEIEREANKALGEWPFEIGLWVGRLPPQTAWAGPETPRQERTAPPTRS